MRRYWVLLAMVAATAHAEDASISLLGGAAEYHYVQSQKGLRKLQGSRLEVVQRIKEKSLHGASRTVGVALAWPVRRNIALVTDLQYVWDSRRDYASHEEFSGGDVSYESLQDSFKASDYHVGISWRPPLAQGITAFLTPGYSWLTQTGEHAIPFCYNTTTQSSCGYDFRSENFHGVGLEAGVDMDAGSHLGLRVQYRREYLNLGMTTSNLSVLARVHF